jgi:glycosyltransferase involved in cell wall biosynthesis
MKIIQFNTYDSGGAGIAAQRLNDGLNLIGENSKLFVKYKYSSNEDVNQIMSSDVHNRLFDRLASKYFLNNIKAGNTITSIMYPSVGFDFLKIIDEFEIINLHWISTFISVEAIMKMHNTGKPIVWTLHDQNPMTGVCHYTNGCNKFKIDCSYCPQLVEDRFNMAKRVLESKINNLPKGITLVTPSNWLAQCASESSVFKNNRIEVIQNSLDTNLYKSYDKAEAKKSLGIKNTSKVILFGANDLTEKRKGFKVLLDMSGKLKEIKYIEELLNNNELCILTFGQGSDLLDTMNLPYKSLGYVSDEHILSTIYSASDVLVLPSIEDNLPNVMLESMSCGTPVVSFDVGGMKDVIIDGYNGYLSKFNNPESLAENVVKIFSNCNEMSRNCREYALKKFTLETQANHYRELYKELIIDNNKVTNVQLNIPYILPENVSFISQCISELSIDLNDEINNLEESCVKLKNKLDVEIQNKESLQLEKNELLSQVTSGEESFKELNYKFEKYQQDNELLLDKLTNLQQSHNIFKEQINKYIEREEAIGKEKDALLTKLVILQENHNNLNREFDAMKQEYKIEIDDKESLLCSLNNQLSNLKNNYNELTEEYTATKVRQDNLLYELDSIYNSKSWVITKPLRVIVKLIRMLIAK